MVGGVVDTMMTIRGGGNAASDDQPFEILH